jgi:L-amino acid N-acyltransferase YncA
MIQPATEADLPGILAIYNVVHFREVGHKFGRWLDLVFLQRLLDRS